MIRLTYRTTAVRRFMGAAVGALVCAAVLSPGSDAVAAPASEPGPLLSYLVVASPHGHHVRDAEHSVRRLGGTVWVTYDEIGVIVARSTDPDFAARLRRDLDVQFVGASRTAGIQTSADDPVVVTSGAASQPAAEAGQDPLEPQQWDMTQIGADTAHQTTLGSRDVVVGVLDSGIDAAHPDLAAAVDASKSVSCIDGGRPNTDPTAWAPTTSGHGTHVSGTIAAAKNGVGVVGVAPGVRLAAVKVVDDSGFIYGEYAVCGFVWAAHHHFRLTNNSYFVDPWAFNCQNDPDQRAISVAVQRAVEFANHAGVLSVAAGGNANQDLNHRVSDSSSPDDADTQVTRPIDNNCLDLPSEAPKVLTVTAVGALGVKASYSSYGKGHVDVTAPGGDPQFQRPAPGISGSVLSTLPGGRWGLLSGTSMASPHAVGVLALLASTHPRASSGELVSMLLREANPIACPEIFDIDGDGTPDATCEGTTADNGFYGHGMVDAAAAVRAAHGGSHHSRG